MVDVRDMGVDPYESGMITARPSFAHRSLHMSVAAVLEAHREQRGLELIPQRTRCVQRFEIHEILVTDDQEARPGARVDRVASVAFIEFETGGVLVEGDRLEHEDRSLGVLVGFDETHAPNHLNIVLKRDVRSSGTEFGLQLGEPLEFKSPASMEREDHGA